MIDETDDCEEMQIARSLKVKPRPIRHRPSPSEEGYILIAVVFLLALLVVAMSIAVPNIIKQIERDREVETMHRGKQYVRALKLYHKKFGNYPPTVDALVKGTNNIRFLRKKYIDPSTGKDEWKPIHYGQNKQPTAFGFFGKPMASMMGGMGMGCGSNGLGGGIGSSDSSSSSFGSSSFGSSSMGSSSFGSSSMGSSSFGSSSMGSSSFGSNGLNSSMGMGSSSPIGGCQSDASGAASEDQAPLAHQPVPMTRPIQTAQTERPAAPPIPPAATTATAALLARIQVLPAAVLPQAPRQAHPPAP